MSTLFINEGDQLGIDSQGNQIMAIVYPLLVPGYSIPITGGQTLSSSNTITNAPFASTTRCIEIHCDVACSIAIGVNPTALTTVDRLGAGERIFRPLRPGVANLQIAVTANT
jgi:hypothetical protein